MNRRLSCFTSKYRTEEKEAKLHVGTVMSRSNEQERGNLKDFSQLHYGEITRQ